MSKSTRTYGALAAIILVAAIAGYLILGRSGSPLAEVSQGQAVEIKPTDMVHGSPNAPVTMVEYASMNCPHCAAFQAQVVPQLTKDYIDTGKVKLVFREFPLNPGATMASVLARCFMGDQYFNFIDLLFKTQDKWWYSLAEKGAQLTQQDVEESLAQVARNAGMSHDQAIACIRNKDNLEIVKNNQQEGATRYMVDSTPTFIINGIPHAGEIPYDQLQKILDPLVGKK